MNSSRSYRQSILAENTKYRTSENIKTPARTRSHHRRGTFSATGVTFWFFLVLATYENFYGVLSGSNSESILLLGPPILTKASAMRTAASTALRRSARLRGVSATMASNAPLQSSASVTLSLSSDSTPTGPKKRQRRARSTSSSDVTKKKTKKAANSVKRKTSAKKKKETKKMSSDSSASELWCLPRTQEKHILSSADKVSFVIGVDEAGRGPLAGPVVAAAAIVPLDINGITDSKKITKEEDREELYKAITESPKVRWAVAVMDASFIDKVNILQATMRGMAACTTALVADAGPPFVIELGEERIPIVPTLSIEQKGCYVVTNKSGSESKHNGTKKKPTVAVVASADTYCALVDGNRVPPDMPCESHSIVKGDSKEYAIAAASILAKVSRDRLMRDYHELWPHFGLEQHKGYPTAAHMQAVKSFGASPIHRMTFRPLKDMKFDKDGKVVID